MDPRRNGFWDNGLWRASVRIGTQIVKSLVFWTLAAVLLSSSYESIMQIRGDARKAQFAAAVGDDVMPDAGILTVPGASGGGQAVPAGDVPDAGPSALLDEDAPGEGIAAVDDGDRKLAALTFDDGPHPVYTAKLLDGLKERGVHATFFVIGKNIPGNEELIRRMDEEGHLIGNHTYNHVKICDMSGEAACEEVERTSALVQEITGKNTEFVRPPFGAWNKQMECSFVMIPVLWDVDPLDWTTKNTELVVQRVLGEVGGGDIILLHDWYDSSVEAALRIVDEMQAQGYEFVTVDHLILE